MGKRLVVLLALLVAGSAFAQGADVGLVNLVAGDVTFAQASGMQGKVQPFMKVRDGDRVAVAAGAQIRIVFYDAARQELWTGPASFRAGKKGAEPVTGKPAEISNLPAGVQQRIARVPDLVQVAKLGGIQVRGGITPAQKASLDQQSSVTEARSIYEKMRTESGVDDVTPELFLFSALHEYLLYDDMKVVAEEMQRRQPENEEIRLLVDWTRKRVSR